MQQLTLTPEHRTVLCDAYRGRTVAHQLAPVVDELGGFELVAFVAKAMHGQAVVLTPGGVKLARLLIDKGDDA